MDLASLIPATVEVEASSAPVRFSAPYTNDSGRFVCDISLESNADHLGGGAGDSGHSVVDFNEMFASPSIDPFPIDTSKVNQGEKQSKISMNACLFINLKKYW